MEGRKIVILLLGALDPKSMYNAWDNDPNNKWIMQGVDPNNKLGKTKE